MRSGCGEVQALPPSPGPSSRHVLSPRERRRAITWSPWWRKSRTPGRPNAAATLRTLCERLRSRMRHSTGSLQRPWKVCRRRGGGRPQCFLAAWASSRPRSLSRLPDGAGRWRAFAGGKRRSFWPALAFSRPPPRPSWSAACQARPASREAERAQHCTISCLPGSSSCGRDARTRCGRNAVRTLRGLPMTWPSAQCRKRNERQRRGRGRPRLRKPGAERSCNSSPMAHAERLPGAWPCEGRTTRRNRRVGVARRHFVE